MLTEIEKLQRINTIDENIFILNYIIKRKQDLLKILQDMPVKMPLTFELPPYNEEKYLVKAKKEEYAQYSEFRLNCIALGFHLMYTIIGIVICWIPWLVALCSFPVQVTGRRKAAYRIYCSECEQILARNRSNMADYEASLKQYHLTSQTYQSQIDILPFQERWLTEQIVKASEKANSLRIEKYSLCKELNIPADLKNQNPHLYIMLLHYMENKSADSIPKALELYKHSGIEALTLDKLNRSKNMYRNLFPTLINVIDKRDQLAEKTFNEFRNNINNLKKNSINPITTNYQVASLEKIYTEI